MMIWCPRCAQIRETSSGMFENFCQACGHPIQRPPTPEEDREGEQDDDEKEVF